jgi:hypothetical protein
MKLLRIAARVAQENPGALPAEAPPVVSQQTQEGQQEQVSYIKHEKGKGYCVKSPKNKDWSGGCYPSEGEAKKRLNQVEMFKHMKKGSVASEDIAHDLDLIAARLANSEAPSLEIVLSDLKSILSAIDNHGQQEQQADWKMTLEDPDGDEAIHIEPGHNEQQGQQEQQAKSPPGWGGVEKMVKDHGFSKERAEAISWDQYNKGHEPHVKEK